jgi:hypothetical protein
MSITSNQFHFDTREKEILTSVINDVSTKLLALEAEVNNANTSEFVQEVLQELKPLTDYVKGVSKDTVKIPSRAIHWLLEHIDNHISNLNRIMPNVSLLDIQRASFKGTYSATLWEYLQLHYKLNEYVANRIAALDGLKK